MRRKLGIKYRSTQSERNVDDEPFLVGCHGSWNLRPDSVYRFKSLEVEIVLRPRRHQATLLSVSDCDINWGEYMSSSWNGLDILKILLSSLKNASTNIQTRWRRGLSPLFHEPVRLFACIGSLHVWYIYDWAENWVYSNACNANIE
jgi:hypothetical protein